MAVMNMVIIKKNIWLVFYIMSIIWIFFGCASVYFVANNVFEEVTTEQRNVTSMSSNSLKAVLNQYEVKIDILARQLLYKNLYLNERSAQKSMDLTTQLDPSIRYFGLFKPDGTNLLASSNLHKEDFPSLLDFDRTRASYLDTLNSPDMIIGRTYLSEYIPGKIAIIPLKKSVRDDDGNVIFVISLGIDAHKGFDFFINNMSENKKYTTYLYRERDRYFQLASQNRLKTVINIYDFQIPEDVLKKSIQELVAKINKPYETIKKEEILVSNISKDSGKGELLLTSTYIKRYGLWLTTDIETKHIYTKIIYQSTLLFIVFFVSLLILYYIFRHVADIEMKKHDDLLYQASHDDITKLYNRFFLDRSICLSNQHQPFWVILIDIDNFKSINTSYGNDRGDQVLKMISVRLNEHLRNNDVLIRYSGNEFIIILYEEVIYDIKFFCEKVLADLRNPYIFPWGNFILTASIGVSHYTTDGKNLDEVRLSAALAMQKAKKIRNTIVVFHESMRDEEIYNYKLTQELKSGLARNEFYMLYQPKVNCQGVLLGVEALVRWKNQSLGVVGPDKFIPIAETSGDMVTIGDFIIQQSLSDLAAVNNASNSKLHLSLNISVKQFLEADFIDKLAHTIGKTGFSPSNLVIEITESLFIEDIFGLKNLLNRLKEMGIRISLDDFGTGYSSLNLLTKLPIDELKIDKSFIDEIEQDISAKHMVEGIISMGKKLNFIIVGEGVESEEQLNKLRAMGCDLFQGYYFSKPLKIEELKRYK
ncbi:bifunctional diguanylate cyclase/phosphodiesterase [Pseudoalteromonas sp. 10-33]|uniref:bifunctional diguanylate cyclase/phosphodiesterase n=1 Tax=Pseudoalteromonas sp. 10-33 TaxID=1761890 RepID=UPI0009EC1B9C|nr:EAL domain-containing protein [Pseudoalteromonas sp. 10-33]